jgi:hypothetical protein
MGCTIDCDTSDDSPVQGQLLTLINQVRGSSATM